MSGDKRIAAFMQVAEEELKAARLLARGAPRQCGFYIQQAAEKMARAILSKEGIRFGTSHSLGQMAALLSPEHVWRERIMTLDRLSPLATKYRYPLESGRLPPPPTIQQLEADIKELARLLAEARRWLGLPPSAVSQNARR
jgi:HEPN domain-containing protein